MQGLITIPSLEQLEQAYAELQSLRQALPARRVIELSQWSRFDARLAEQLVSHLVNHWKAWSVGELREALEQTPWPAAFGVLMAHGRLHPELDRASRRAFNGMIEAVLSGLPRGDGGSFFIGTRTFGGRQQKQDAEWSSSPYSSWGYFGRDLLLNKAARVTRTAHSAEQRRRALDLLIEELEREGRPLYTRDYRAALGNRISPRLAELDLQAHPRLVARGQTRGRVYLIRRRKHSSS
ncbi:MAG: hypothetical protein RJB38_1748 [Pseudomonadota bacterium]|jgi:hypothetical protein